MEMGLSRGTGRVLMGRKMAADDQVHIQRSFFFDHFCQALDEVYLGLPSDMALFDIIPGSLSYELHHSVSR
jgi:hypothetical protein